jgi:hypothetical protein
VLCFLQGAPPDWPGGAVAGLALLALPTANGSTALEVAQRWGESAFAKLLNAKKRELEAMLKV